MLTDLLGSDEERDQDKTKKRGLFKKGLFEEKRECALERKAKNTK